VRKDLFTLTGAGEPEALIGMMVSAEFFSVLRTRPLMGRTFTKEEDHRGAPSVVLLGETFWKRRFKADETLIGKALTLNGRDYTVVGIVPASVRLDRDRNTFFNDVFTPIGQYDDELFYKRGAGIGTTGLGRLKPGVTLKQAQSEMDAIMRNLAAEYPDDDANTGANLIEFKEYVAGKLRPTLLALAAAVGFVLLIACTNVANLALARSSNRGQEFGVRLALGARRGRLTQQLLTECGLISIAGGAVGVLIASWGTAAALVVLPSALPAISRVEINGRVLIFTLAVSLAVGVLFGLVPALKAAGANLHDTLKQGGRGAIKRRYRAQHLLIVAEIAFTLVLLVGAGLMMRSLQKLWTVDPGFDPETVLTFYTSISPQRAPTPEKIRAALLEMNDRLSSIPGVESAGVEFGGLPFHDESTAGFLTEKDDKTSKPRDMSVGHFYAVTPGHFKTMGIPLRRGRSFTPQDRAGGPLVVIIDEELARKEFGDQDPIGKHMFNQMTLMEPSEIVGIAGHVKQSGLDSDATSRERSQYYIPLVQVSDVYLPLASNVVTGIVRTKMNPADVITAVRSELASFNSGRAVFGEQLMTDAIADSLARRRFSIVVLGAFAATALALALVGIYSVVSYFVSQRTNEFGVRIALGAQSGDIFRDVLSEGGKLGLIGIAVGIAGALGLTRLMTSLLFGISPTDVVTFFSAALLLFTLTLIACYIPARRAVRVDPMSALRTE
jgi:predicted permease